LSQQCFNRVFDPTQIPVILKTNRKSLKKPRPVSYFPKKQRPSVRRDLATIEIRYNTAPSEALEGELNWSTVCLH